MTWFGPRKTLGSMWSPKTLFLGGLAGAFYDVSRLDTMFQDSAGTTPAAVDQPVGLHLDLSGINNSHRSQAVSGKRPILRLSSGRYRLEYDGVDDFLSAAFTISLPWTRFSGIQQISWINGGRIHNAPGVASGILQMISASPSIRGSDGAGGPVNANAAVGADVVITEVHAGAGTSSLQVNLTTAVTATAGTTESDGWRTGTNQTGASPGNFYDYGGAMVAGAVSALNTLRMQRWLAAKMGISI